jgi:hypothetical protein
MKKNLFALGLLVFGLSMNAQTPRLSLYEEFTGETCPPCATANPPLNALLHSATNFPKIVAIKWQVPIPSAPTKTWSLYQTNKTEIDWRWKSVANGGYGYIPAINSAPSGKIDGQSPTVFGASSGHPNNLNNTVISTAQSYTSAFAVNLSRAWNKDCSAITVTVDITASASFAASGNLVFRLVMVERLIQFSVQPGTNGETKFEDVAIKSFPTLQAGTSLPSTWTNGQNMTFTVNCPVPSYTRKKEEIAFVGFIQDDGNQKVAQAVRSSTAALPADQVIINGASVKATCANSITPTIMITNNGQVAITSLTITPYTDNVAGSDLTWTGNLAVGASTTIAFNAIPTSTVAGAHSFSFNVTNLNNAANYNITLNSSKVNYLVASSFQGVPVAEGFVASTFPPAGWVSANPNGGSSWSRATNAGGYNLTFNSTKYDFFNNSVVGDVDELYLPPMDLSGADAPVMDFDIAYAVRTQSSNDKLEIYASSDCGANWTSFFDKAGTSLADIDPTTGIARADLFAYTPDPSDASHWRTESINLTGFNKPNVLVKFVTTSDNGNNLYLDNINLQQKNPLGISKVNTGGFNTEVFPNPSNGVTTVRVNSKVAGSAKITVSNTLGQLVYTKDLTLETGVNNVTIDVKDFASGIYNVVVDSKNGQSVNKLTVSK